MKKEEEGTRSTVSVDEKNLRDARSKARKASRARMVSAQKKYKIMHNIPLNLKEKAIDEYFDWRQKQDPEVVKAAREDARDDPHDCPWCSVFMQHGFNHCLHCGKMIEVSKKDLKSPPPS